MFIVEIFDLVWMNVLFILGNFFDKYFGNLFCGVIG